MWGSVFLTIWHRILNADSTKTPSSSITFQRFCWPGCAVKLNSYPHYQLFAKVFIFLRICYCYLSTEVTCLYVYSGASKIQYRICAENKCARTLISGHIWYVNDNLIYAHLHRLLIWKRWERSKKILYNFHFYWSMVILFI